MSSKSCEEKLIKKQEGIREYLLHKKERIREYIAVPTLLEPLFSVSYALGQQQFEDYMRDRGRNQFEFQGKQSGSIYRPKNIKKKK